MTSFERFRITNHIPYENMKKAKSNLHLEEYSVKFYLSFASLSKFMGVERMGILFEKLEGNEKIFKNTLSSRILYLFWLTKEQRQGGCVCYP